MRRTLLHLAFLPVCAFAFGCMGCDVENEDKPVALTQVINAEYLEFYSLAESPDANHETSIAGPDGKTWYRSESPGIDLTHIDVRETYKHPPLKTSEETYLAYLWLKREHMDTFYQWIMQLVGKPIGVVLRGELVQVLVVEDLVRTQTIAIEFPTYDEAMREIKRISSGGIHDIRKTQPGDGEEGSWGTKAGSQPAITSSAEDLISSLQVFTTLVEMNEEESKQTRVMAWLLNRGDQPVRIY